ncbi:DUF427 domain-containing protein [Microbacterium halotolerans]|uniref:DUF427 domain-containing protein n=1 Tax=Microbacterium halotolerans TaxID=246613 RepID=UPI000E6AA0CC|nr:DUF427 domain-containing protein [Microbacterium halotolerans]
MRALWRDLVVAEASDEEIIEVDGAWFFPPHSVNRELLVPSETGYTCSWRGDASYFSIEAEGEREPDAAWCYPHMDDAAIARIGVDAREHLAFSPAVSVIPS